MGDWTSPALDARDQVLNTLNSAVYRLIPEARCGDPATLDAIGLIESAWRQIIDGCVWRVLAVQFEPQHIEETREYWASNLSEALMLAERQDAGKAEYTYGILPEDYEQARAEGIAFNEADGLLMEQ